MNNTFPKYRAKTIAIFSQLLSFNLIIAHDLKPFRKVQEYQLVLAVTRYCMIFSPILFSMYLNDIERKYVLNGAARIDIGMLKLFLLLYADDIILFANDKENLQLSLNILENYCNRWKLKVNTQKTKVMVLRKGDRLRDNISFYYDGAELEIVNKFVYLGVTFTTGGSFHETQNCLAGKGLKAIFKMNK